MAVYVVTWNLNKERSNYAQARKEFIENLNRYENVGDPALETVRWVSTTWSAAQISNDLRTKMDDNDRIFISQVTAGTNSGWLNRDVWDWINSKL
ncbi:hypothetical protein [Lysobacter sp. Root690]|uniref:hypothetical protein n=1 Tax=Lysobacter sp. Root690 TaxID=1736588 RepID=UPI0006FDFBD8|nr:hypothetical protein [Lysobacter sp. Root690]KRB10300.1 hypothetical protein ASD86_25225 [Lysobacter sp. Root690]